MIPRGELVNKFPKLALRFIPVNLSGFFTKRIIETIAVQHKVTHYKKRARLAP
jgi:hypothetical protein